MKLLIIENSELPNNIKLFLDNSNHTYDIVKANESHAFMVGALCEYDYWLTAPTIYRPSDINKIAHDISHGLRIGKKDRVTTKGLVIYESKADFLSKIKYVGLDALSSLGGIIEVMPIYFYESDIEFDQLPKLIKSDILSIVRNSYEEDSNIRFGRWWYEIDRYRDSDKFTETDELKVGIGQFIGLFDDLIEILENTKLTKKNQPFFDLGKRAYSIIENMTHNENNIRNYKKYVWDVNRKDVIVELLKSLNVTDINLPERINKIHIWEIEKYLIDNKYITQDAFNKFADDTKIYYDV